MTYTVSLLPGDGIGPEVNDAARRVLEATGVSFKWEIMPVGEEAIAKYNTPLPDFVLENILKNKVALKGPITTPIGTGFRSINVAIRLALDLYANIRPCKSMKGVRSRYDNVDLVVVRENTEDLYAGIEFDYDTKGAKDLVAFIRSNGMKVREDSAFSIKPISVTGSRRIVKYAFDYARANKRKKVSAITKANIMKFSDGLFLKVAREVAKDYPDIQYQEWLVDALGMSLVQRPEEWDVLVLPNLYGDIMSDMCAGLVGGLGIAAGANIGEKGAVFEPVHGSAPRYAGQNKVNPTAEILSAVLMLRHIGEGKAADLVQKAVEQIIAEGKEVTYDLKLRRDDPTAVGTSQMADAIIRRMKDLK